MVTVSTRFSIRPATADDLPAINRLCRACWLDTNHPEDARRPSAIRDSAVDAEQLRRALPDDCLLTGRLGGELVALSALNLESAQIFNTCVAPDRQGLGLGRRMIAAVEQTAVQFGITALNVWAQNSAISFFTACGYRRRTTLQAREDPSTGAETWAMARRIARRQTRFGRRIAKLLDHCGIPTHYGRTHRLRLQEECRELATVGVGPGGREYQLAPDAARAWLAMQRAADTESVILLPASAFRSVGYQVTIIERKKQRGQSIDEILSVSAAPGYSEHHSGRAIDVTTPGSRALETEFEDTLAFEWLVNNAERFRFRLSYPRNNRHGILYEPWHWYYTGNV